MEPLEQDVRVRAKRNLIKIGLLVLLVALLGGGYWWYASRYQETSEVLDPQSIKVTAREGRIISNFPQELILEQGFTIEESYSVNYEGGKATQPVLKYVSQYDFGRNYEIVDKYLYDHGWDLAYQGLPDERPSTYFYAYRENAEINITLFERSDKKVVVNIAYVNHQ